MITIVYIFFKRTFRIMKFYQYFKFKTKNYNKIKKKKTNQKNKNGSQRIN